MIPCSPSPVTYHPSPKKAGIFDPYLDTLGGGERYALTFAEALLNKSWEVEFTSDNKVILEEARKRFDLNLKNLKINNLKNFSSGSFLKRYLYQNKYDLLFWVSDGSIPLMLGKKNLLHFQIPFKDVGGKSLKNSLKLKLISKVICNSFFTKRIVEKEYGLCAVVWYPPVSVEEFCPGKKENEIIGVGRFEQSMTEKRQDVLIESFKKMVDNGLKGWKLILAGGCAGDKQKNDYLQKLKKSAIGFPIQFEVNIPFDRLKNSYARAKIFWHAAGYGVNEEKNPEKTEHFGMSTVEAMSAGCVPVVVGKGGQKEIIDDGKSGFLWAEKNELSRKTIELIQNERLLKQMSGKAIVRSKDFSKKIFYQRVYGLI